MVNNSRILIISYNFPPDISAGAFRMYNLIKHLSKYENLSIDIVTSTPNRYSNFKSLKENNYFENCQNVNIYKIESLFSNTGFLKEILTYLNYFIKTIQYSKKNNYNLIFATSSRLMTGFLGAYISKFKKVPFYFDIRDIFLDTLKYSNTLFYFLLYPFLQYLEHFTVKNSQHINIVSKGFEKYFKNKYKINSLSINTNGIDDNFIKYFKNRKVSFPRRSKIEVLYVGNVGDGQGLHKIIPNILQNIDNNVNFKIIGSGRKLGILKKIMLKKNIIKCKFVDPIDRELLMSEYDKASILFLHLNDYEAFYKVLPSKIFEYATTGKPIIAGVNGFAKEFILHNIKNAKVFKPCDYKEAIKQINEIDLNLTDRSDFISKFARNEISNNITKEIINLIKNEQK